MIRPHVVQHLIQIGRSGDPDDPTTAAHLDAIAKYSSINRKHWKDWNEITDPMPTHDVVALTKGLVLAELRHRWIGGSVAAAIWTFREVESRDTLVADELADWILPRTRNSYLPYGSNNHGTSSAKEY